MRVADHFAGISATDDVHHRVAVEKVLVFLAFHDVDAFENASSSFHFHVHIRVAHHDGIFAESSAEHAELRCTDFFVDFFPLNAFKEILAGVTSSHHFCAVVKESLCHGEIGVVAHNACNVSATVDIVVHFELTCFRVVLRRVNRSVYDAGRTPCACLHIP